MRRTLLLLVLLAVVGGSALLAAHVRSSGEAIDAFLEAEKFRALEERRKLVWASCDERGHERLGTPREGEWLFRFPETGQTVDEYRAQCGNRRRPGRETIALRPLAPLSSRALAALEPARRFCAAFFQMPVRVAEPAPLSEKAFRAERGQYDIDPLLATLKGEVGDDELVRAGYADKDLCWPAKLPNFVFGGASLTDRVGIYSLERFGRGVVPEPLYRRRTFQLLAHELGHVLGMAHCPFYRCLMQGTNSLAESDAIPVHLCPICAEKLRWNVGFDPVARDAALASVFSNEALADEAAWASRPR